MGRAIVSFDMNSTHKSTKKRRIEFPNINFTCFWPSWWDIWRWSFQEESCQIFSSSISTFIHSRFRWEKTLFWLKNKWYFGVDCHSVFSILFYFIRWCFAHSFSIQTKRRVKRFSWKKYLNWMLNCFFVLQNEYKIDFDGWLIFMHFFTLRIHPLIIFTND